MTQQELANESNMTWEEKRLLPRYRTQGFLGVSIDENTEMVTLDKNNFMKLCFDYDHATGGDSAFLFHHKLANDTEVQVPKIVYNELLRYKWSNTQDLVGAAKEILDKTTKEFWNHKLSELELAKVVCDETNNTKESLARNEYNVDAYDEKRNIVVEYDEPHHYVKGNLKKKRH